MKKRILIVGGGYGQVPAIKKAKKLGLETIVVDRNKNAIGMSLADYSYIIDTVDRNTILSVAKKHNISGIMTMQSDLPVPSVGYVNDKLGLNGIGLQTANFCSNKIETREKLNKENCSQPKYKIVSSIEEILKAINYIGFPCVIKAPDSSGSRGVIKVDNKDSIEEAFHQALFYTKNDKILVEEYIEGLEFGAQTFSINGKCEIVLLHNDIMSTPPYMIPIGHSFPFKCPENIDKESINKDIIKAIKAVKINNGPANIDLIWDKKSNSVKIIEIGARIGATCLPELIYYHTGIDWVTTTILNAIGEPVDINIHKEKPVAAFILESPKDGIFCDFHLRNEKIKRNILEFEITVKKGDEVSKLRKGTDRIGKVLAYGSSAEDAEDKVINIRKSIIINVQ
ncbi:MAG: ATP-grasp domain-containing protein [Dysgonomonas sp.]